MSRPRPKPTFNSPEAIDKWLDEVERELARKYSDRHAALAGAAYDPRCAPPKDDHEHG